MSYIPIQDPIVLAVPASGAAGIVPVVTSQSGVKIANTGSVDMYVALQPSGNTALTAAQILAGQWSYKIPAGYTDNIDCKVGTQCNVAAASVSTCAYQAVC